MNAALNGGLLPKGFYALPEQHTGHAIADILTLHSDPPPPRPVPPLPPPPATGGTILAEAPPRVRRRQTLGSAAAVERRRTLAVRHVSGHRLVALLEIVSPGNKDRVRHLQDFAAKAVDALERGVHLLVIDLFPPGPHDPDGIHGLIARRLEQSDKPYDLPVAEPLTLAAYEAAGERVEIYLEHLAAGAAQLPDMPLFLHPERYVNVPLDATYRAAYRGMPAYWRDVLEGRPPAA